MMRAISLWAVLATALLLHACRDTHIKQNDSWNATFEKYGISNGAFIVRDHTHDRVYYNNLENCSRRYLPASTFKIFNSLVALEERVAPDENLVIKWDGVTRWLPAWNQDLNMREAFKVSSLPYYQEVARRIGRAPMQHYLDTANYGNKTIGDTVDAFWIDGSLQISADEQVGLMRRLYFNELPFSDRTQRIVRSMMLRDDEPNRKLYYKTGWGTMNDTNVLWVVGFSEKIVHVKEHKNSMNKSDIREVPYFFALNFTTTDTTKNWLETRINLTKELLHQADAW